MALEAVVYPQPQEYPFAYSSKDICSLVGGAWGYEFCLQEEDKPFLGVLDTTIIEQQGLHANRDSSSSSPSFMQHTNESSWGPNISSPEAYAADQSLSGRSIPYSMEAPPPPPPPPAAAAAGGGGGSRRKRRRTKSSKNKEEIENQRMTHIAVERNRRKQMNEYLAILRSLMPPSYVQRGDQASIIGGSINFVKELEQLLQSMETEKRKSTLSSQAGDIGFSFPFAEFFTFPQYSIRATRSSNLSPNDSKTNDNVAEIEVNMSESHANIKILTKRRPRQLLKMIASFHNLRLSVIHLNVSTMDKMVLYSVSVKVEEGSQVNTVDEIAAAVNQIMVRIEEEAATAFS